ncbi:programmed cell death protein 5 [Nematocida homosporus]|uniref:programmed cell death protein 5 n=1 Tax=Nematocida homosporus TaxID=1912981 RepID=UPI00221FED6C|nr:programmed cell death protein 5 [Nematocida homosporus]KAI5184757.1 programmed cell death protein 5 [Nematocida homosporus]
MSSNSPSSSPAVDKQAVAERIELALASLLSKESLARLINIKAVDLERYYRIEGILLSKQSQGVSSINDYQFKQILQSTEKQKQTLIYTRKSPMFDLDDD